MMFPRCRLDIGNYRTKKCVLDFEVPCKSKLMKCTGSIWKNAHPRIYIYIFQTVLLFYAMMINLAVSKMQDQWTLNFPSSHITFMRPAPSTEANWTAEMSYGISKTLVKYPPKCLQISGDTVVHGKSLIRPHSGEVLFLTCCLCIFLLLPTFRPFRMVVLCYTLHVNAQNYSTNHYQPIK